MKQSFIDDIGYRVLYITCQDYGPKVNFKRRNLKLGSFCGLPPFSRLLVERMRGLVDTLADFTPVELCNLDYQPERGAHIEAHRDDSWLWGERLVTVNLLSCSSHLHLPSLLTPSLLHTSPYTTHLIRSSSLPTPSLLPPLLTLHNPPQALLTPYPLPPPHL